jgi:peptidoglycan hydrolase CwlO-like protein
MSEDLTGKLPKSNGEILTAIKNLDEHVGKIDSRLQNLEEKVNGLEKNVDERLHDTRPIWHKVVAEIGEFQNSQKRLEAGQKDLEAGQKSLKQSQSAMREQIGELYSIVREVNRDQIVLNDSVRRIQLDFHSFDERLLNLINKRNQQNSQT